MRLDPKKQEAFEKLGKLSGKISEGMIELISMISESHFERINDQYDLDLTLQNQLTEVLAFASMNATIQTLVTLVETMLETFGDTTPNQNDLIKMSNEIAFSINQRLSQVFPDLIDLNDVRLRKEELN